MTIKLPLKNSFLCICTNIRSCGFSYITELTVGLVPTVTVGERLDYGYERGLNGSEENKTLGFTMKRKLDEVIVTLVPDDGSRRLLTRSLCRT